MDCIICGDRIENWDRSTRDYCSPKCKQKAYRLRKKAERDGNGSVTATTLHPVYIDAAISEAEDAGTPPVVTVTAQKPVATVKYIRVMCLMLGIRDRYTTGGWRPKADMVADLVEAMS